MTGFMHEGGYAFETPEPALTVRHTIEMFNEAQRIKGSNARIEMLPIRVREDAR